MAVALQGASCLRPQFQVVSIKRNRARIIAQDIPGSLWRHCPTPSNSSSPTSQAMSQVLLLWMPPAIIWAPDALIVFDCSTSLSKAPSPLHQSAPGPFRQSAPPSPDQTIASAPDQRRHLKNDPTQLHDQLVGPDLTPLITRTFFGSCSNSKASAWSAAFHHRVSTRGIATLPLIHLLTIFAFTRRLFP